MDPLSDLGLGEGAPQGAQAGDRKRRPLDPAQQGRAVVGVEESKALDVHLTGLAAEQLGVALDPVEQGGGESGANFHSRRLHVLREDRRGRAVFGPDVTDGRLVAAALRMVIDHDIDLPDLLRDFIPEDRGLDVD